MYQRHAMAALLTVMPLGCSVDDVLLEGKQCPCGEGFICNPYSGTCVAGAREPLGHPDALVKPRALEAQWTTASCIRWTWSRGDGDDGDGLAGYQLHVTDEGGDTVVFAGTTDDATDATYVNQELARYIVPRVDGESIVLGTITDQHTPESTYQAQLIAFDTEGREFRTNVATANTSVDPTREIIVFSEEEFGDSSQPADFTRTMGNAYAGDYHYSWVNDECPGEDRCFEFLSRSGLDLDTSRIDSPAFESTALMEFAFASDESEPSFHTELRIHCLGIGEAPNLYAPVALRADGNYRLLQIPFRFWTFEREEITLGDLAGPCTIWGIGGLYETGATIRIDEVRIRY